MMSPFITAPYQGWDPSSAGKHLSFLWRHAMHECVPFLHLLFATSFGIFTLQLVRSGGLSREYCLS